METSALSYQFDDFTLDLARGCVLKGIQEVKLRPKVYEVLKYMVEHPGRLVGKQELMQAVWPDAFVTDDSLVQCALELRRALNDRDQQLLRTVPRRGYLFAAEVIRHSKKADQAPPPVASPYDPSDDRALLSRRLPRKRPGLPIPRTSLIGREQQMADATELLLRENVRLLSLTGPGGAGKTRLAVALASAIAHKFTAGVQFVSLASIRDPDLVGTAIGDALEIQQVANRTLPQLIGANLQNCGPFLLLLDNFEQVLPAAKLVAEILEACPSLKILTTSRFHLRVYGEQEFPVTPLAENFALELFAQCAAAVWPGFAITSENASAIREICSRLDGLPLAIELAAARTRALSPSAILERLHRRLQLLTGGAVDLPERQQTLRSAIDWSYGLLSEKEQKLFRRLSVFVGGCTLEAAEAVCNTQEDLGIDVLEGLSSLVDKNLAHRMDRSQSEPRFAMLETIREYALERLVDGGEQPAVRRAQAAYCLVLAEEGNPELNASDRSAWLAHCDAEIENFRVALDWLFETADLDWAFRLCVALFRFWDMREHLTEGRIRLETLLRMAGSERAGKRARVLHFLGALSTAQGDYPKAEDCLQQSLSLYEELADDAGIAASLNALGVSARDRGDYAVAQSNFERSLACWRVLSNRLETARCLHNLANVVEVRGDYARSQWALRESSDIFTELGDRNGAAWSLNQQGDIARAQGDMVAARELYQRALAVFRETGDHWGSARSLADLGSIECQEGDHLAARAAYREGLQIFAGLGHRRGAARALEGSACLALARGQAVQALKLAAAATHLRQLIGAPLHPAEQLKLDQTLLPAWQSLTDAEGKRVWAEGFTLSLEEAIQYSLEESDAATPS
ncbi:MAG TPA: tetratricopeptide repeat protein [Candidatus Acidoferrum sp.]|nr:tetratricopeptide repeat protein [Candidatus Acidoferrum sp.]